MRNQLTEAFGTYGTVVNVRLPTDRESGELKGIGFVEFESTEAKVGTVVCSRAACLGSCWAVVRAALVCTCHCTAAFGCTALCLPACAAPACLPARCAALGGDPLALAGDDTTQIQRRRRTCGYTNRAF